jgi:hypothetical protein
VGSHPARSGRRARAPGKYLHLECQPLWTGCRLLSLRASERQGGPAITQDRIPILTGTSPTPRCGPVHHTTTLVACMAPARHQS